MDGGDDDNLLNATLEACRERYGNLVAPSIDGLYCNWTWDLVLCWPPTKAGTIARQRCPSWKGVDPTKFAIRRCSVDGRWEGRIPDDFSSPKGWTNYTPCYTKELFDLYNKLYAGSNTEAQVKLEIAERTRTLEIIGFSLSLAALLISLAIFCHFRTLRNNRTRIHKNLFFAMIIQVVIRLTLYIDQAIIRGGGSTDAASEPVVLGSANSTSPCCGSEGENSGSVSSTSTPPDGVNNILDQRAAEAVADAIADVVDQTNEETTLQASTPSPTISEVISPHMKVALHTNRQGIDNTPLLCEASYVLLEYARTAMFMWMFIEGLYLHNMITVTVFQEKSYYKIYSLVGWGAPVIMTTAWAVITGIYHGQSRCWWGYNLTKYFWILEGPRLGVILLNFFFLLNIIRVLVVKLRQSHTSEIERVRKAVRAALVLLPLLGITNLVNMTEAPLERSALEFGLWSYVTHFLTSFQGFFIAFLYCFLNGEVRLAVMKSVSVYLSLRRRPNAAARRHSAILGMYIPPLPLSPPLISPPQMILKSPSRRIDPLGSGAPVGQWLLCVEDEPHPDPAISPLTPETRV